MILGIDFGLAHIGLAVSEGEIATPYLTLAVKNQQSAVEEIKKIVEKLKVKIVVVGVSEGKSGERAVDFGNKLEVVLRLPMEFVDETLSTIEASSVKRRDKGKDHERAAAIILQRYLDNA